MYTYWGAVLGIAELLLIKEAVDPVRLPEELAVVDGSRAATAGVASLCGQARCMRRRGQYRYASKSIVDDCAVSREHGRNVRPRPDAIFAAGSQRIAPGPSRASVGRLGGVPVRRPANGSDGYKSDAHKSFDSRDMLLLRASGRVGTTHLR